MAISEEILSTLSDMVFIGNVSSTLPDEGKAIVTRLDRDGVVTAPLSVLNRGTASAKDYWMPAIDDQVLCIMLPNRAGRGFSDGFIIGTFFSQADPVPGGSGDGKRVLDVPGDMTLNVGGTLAINSSSGDVVVNGISLVHHVHGGVQSGGGTTGTPK